MSNQCSNNHIYGRLLWDYVETCETQRLLKTRSFVRQFYSLATPEEITSIITQYPVLPLIQYLVKGLAKAVGIQMSNGLRLLPFNRKKVVEGIRIYSFRMNEDRTLGLTDPISSTPAGEYFFGDFIASMHSVKKHSDYTIVAYDAFEYAYQELLKHNSGSFTDLPDSKAYLYLGPKALSCEDIEPLTRMVFMILALIVDQPDDFEEFYSYYLDSLWDYHHEKTGLFLIENDLTDANTLAEALSDDRLIKICPALSCPSLKNVISYFHDDFSHCWLTANQLMSAQFSDALYLTI